MALGQLPVAEARSAVACCAPVVEPGLTDDEASATARLFKALADPHRVRIVNLLATSDEPICGCDLEGPLGLSQPTVSFHLKKLHDVGLLDREKRGVWAYWSLNREATARLSDVLRFDTEEGAR
jgi:ArsR family transcriptional regulator, arsenate/arsenite/antimonite-responsive transcriptional repressor